MSAGLTLDPHHRLRRREGGAVGPVGAEDVEGVGDGDDPGFDWDLLAGQAVRVAGAVHALVVVEHAQHLAREAAGGAEDRETELGVGAHDPPLGFGQRAPLVQDLRRDPQLAHIVEQAGPAQDLLLLGGQAEGPPDAHGQIRHTPVMSFVRQCRSVRHHHPPPPAPRRDIGPVL